ncbi:phage tail protein [Burkholderia sp. GS2Y]|uniref:Phage tail protein n=1 Tax=Burkholderia theae TaxID=3143496 RepID=A0ABU9WCQ0_9BURK
MSLYSQETSIAAVGGGMPVVGTARNVAMGVATASATATLTADEIIVCSALGGVAYKLANFNQSINLATVGASGMDAGTAPVSGFVALYAIYNPTTRASALLATNATSSLAPSVYGGGNMPAGYTASALVSVWPTNASSQFAVGMQDDRKVWITPQTALNTSTQQSSLTSLSISSLVPKGAKRISGNIAVGSSSATASMTGQVAGSAQGFGGQQLSAYSGVASQAYTTPFNDVPVLTSQTMYYSAVVNTGTMALTITLTAYTF